MTRVLVICEGPTEVEFVRRCLAPHFVEMSIWLEASVLQARSGQHRGGFVTVERIVSHIQFTAPNFDFVTTLVDLYGFQNRDGRDAGTLCRAILEDWRVAPLLEGAKPKVIPYVQVHEFEALLFSDITAFMAVPDAFSDGQVIKNLQEIVNGFDTPEHINDGPLTAPSKRILSTLPKGTYGKVEHGALVAQRIGVPKMRAACPGFDRWVGQLEGLAD